MLSTLVPSSALDPVRLRITHRTRAEGAFHRPSFYSALVKTEREARSLPDPNDHASRSNLTSPLPPLCTPAMQARIDFDHLLVI